jgi:flagellar biosynthesis/type III secretory pathway protein FliH
MSNDPCILRFRHPLGAVRAGRVSEQLHAADAGGEDQQTTQESRLLQSRHEALSRREADLTRREAEILAKGRDLDLKLTQLRALVDGIRKERTSLLEDNEQEIVSLSLGIAEKVLQHEIENGRYRIEAAVRSALDAVRNKGATVVRVNPQDYELTKAAVEKLDRVHGSARVSVVPDASIPPASCCIETDSGRALSEVQGSLERIEQSLLKKRAS